MATDTTTTRQKEIKHCRTRYLVKIIGQCRIILHKLDARDDKKDFIPSSYTTPMSLVGSCISNNLLIILLMHKQNLIFI